MKRFIHITSGRGPAECQWVVFRFLAISRLQALLRQKQKEEASKLETAKWGQHNRIERGNARSVVFKFENDIPHMS